MAEEPKKMKTIWYFVGIVLLVFGALVLLAGILSLFNPPAAKTALAELHPNLWWGGLMVVMGGLFLFTTRKMTV